MRSPGEQQLPVLLLVDPGADPGQSGFPWFRGKVDRSHAMTLRLSIDDQPDQDKAPVHGAAKAGGRRALPQ